MNFEYVIFDFDGTIADTREGVFGSIVYALESYGIDEPDESVLQKFLGPPLVAGFMENIGVDEPLAEKLTAKYRELYTDNAMYLLSLFDGIEELLKNLKSKNIKLAIASSKPQNFFDKLLKHLKITDYFDAVCGASLGDKEVGKKDIILRAIDNLGADNKSKVLMVGDRCFDIDGAKEAGVKSVGVTFGFGSEEELRSSGADFIAETAEDIEKIIFG